MSQTLALCGITKRYGRQTVVEDVDLSVEQGEFVVLLGPSGCGKTTTLRMIAGFVQPDRGQVLIDGEDVTLTPPRQRGVGMVFQNYALFPTMTVEQNVGFSLVERKLDRRFIAERVGHLLDMVRLSSYAKRLPAELSGGQQQRVALARALAHSPKLLLLDEPMGALDLKLRVSMQLELKRLQRELGVTAILVTHDQDEAMTLGDRIVLMSQGKVEQSGTPYQIYREPNSEFVADFIGRVNMIRADVAEQSEAATRLRIADGFYMDARPCRHVAVGDRVRIAVRPESFRIAMPPDGLAATIVQRRFLGNIIIYVTRLADGQTVVVQRSTRHALLDEGERIGLACNPDAASLFPHAPVDESASL